MRRLSWFLALSPPRKRLLFHALIALPLCYAALTVTGFRRLQAILSGFHTIDIRGAPARSRADFDRIQSTMWAVRAAANHGLVRGQCLQQSLTLWWLLQRQNLEGEIRFGARRRDDKLEAHAWVEVGGAVLPLGAEESPSFVPFAQARVPIDVGR